jgi:hypothetical protein
MFPLILGLAQRLALWFLAILLLGGEYLDWFGRLEVLEMKHPKVYRFVNSRPLRLVLLVLLFAMLATDLRTSIRGANTEPLVVKPIIPSADERAKNAEIARLQQQLNALTRLESPNSLRKRTVRLAAEIDKFWNDQPPQPGGPPNNAVTEEEKKRVQGWEQYWRDRRAAYDSHSFQDKVAEIVGAYQGKNIPVGNLEWSIKYNRMIGGTLYRGDEETPPQVLCGTDTCLLRELAFHVNARDEVITPDF